MKPLPKASRRRRDGWSPTYKVLNKMLATMIRIRQHLTGQAGKIRWRSWYVSIGVKKQIDQLLTFAARELPDPDKLLRVLGVTNVDPSYWLTMAPSEPDMTTQAKALLKAIHGRKRTEKRRKMSTVHRNR
jgi:hypothetical protein